MYRRRGVYKRVATQHRGRRRVTKVLFHDISHALDRLFRAWFALRAPGRGTLDDRGGELSLPPGERGLFSHFLNAFSILSRELP